MKTNLISIYAVGLMVSTDSCNEHWEEMVITPFYKTKEQAMQKYDKLIQLPQEKRKNL